MEDSQIWQTLGQFIGSVGFPIVAATAMFYLYDRTIKELTATITKIDTTLDHLMRHIEGGSDADAR